MTGCRPRRRCETRACRGPTRPCLVGAGDAARLCRRRGMVYLAVASFSLYAIWQGGRAQGTSPVLKHLESSAIGDIVLVLIGVGMLAFAVWCAVDAYFDLDDSGSNAKGIAARLGIAVSGRRRGGHRRGRAAVAGGRYRRKRRRGRRRRATSLRRGSGGSRIDHAVATAMGWPAGRGRRLRGDRDRRERRLSVRRRGAEKRIAAI